MLFEFYRKIAKSGNVPFVIHDYPTYTERYVPWCEGTVDKLIIYLLLDLNILVKSEGGTCDEIC